MINIYKIIGISGLVLITVGIMVKKRETRDILSLLGGLGLLIYSIYIRDWIFIILQLIYTLVVFVDFKRLKHGKWVLKQKTARIVKQTTMIQITAGLLKITAKIITNRTRIILRNQEIRITIKGGLIRTSTTKEPWTRIKIHSEETHKENEIRTWIDRTKID